MTRALRVLVVEDEMMVAMLVEDMLQELGHVTVGPAARLEVGVNLATSEALDLAILDVNLGPTKSFPIADKLIARGIPVIFATGYGPSGLEQQYARCPVLTKPFDTLALGSAIREAGPANQSNVTNGAIDPQSRAMAAWALDALPDD